VKSFFCRFCGRETVHYNIARAAALAGVCRETIYRWLRAGRIHGISFPSHRTMLCIESLLIDTGEKVLKVADQTKQ
jgi:predicted site-specific integrase-resolvase